MEEGHGNNLLLGANLKGHRNFVMLGLEHGCNLDEMNADTDHLGLSMYADVVDSRLTTN